jgi:hypothetical protein
MGDKQQELKNLESDYDSMFYLLSIFLNSLFTTLHTLANWAKT